MNIYLVTFGVVLIIIGFYYLIFKPNKRFELTVYTSYPFFELKFYNKNDEVETKWSLLLSEKRISRSRNPRLTMYHFHMKKARWRWNNDWCKFYVGNGRIISK